jgi:hypothetical protein
MIDDPGIGKQSEINTSETHRRFRYRFFNLSVPFSHEIASTGLQNPAMFRAEL